MLPVSKKPNSARLSIGLDPLDVGGAQLEEADTPRTKLDGACGGGGGGRTKDCRLLEGRPACRSRRASCDCPLLLLPAPQMAGP